MVQGFVYAHRSPDVCASRVIIIIIIIIIAQQPARSADSFSKQIRRMQRLAHVSCRPAPAALARGVADCANAAITAFGCPLGHCFLT